MSREPAIAKELSSTPKSWRILCPTKRKDIIIIPDAIVIFPDCIDPYLALKLTIIGIEPNISITEKSTRVTENIFFYIYTKHGIVSLLL